jgi:hypothetical protein
MQKMRPTPAPIPSRFQLANSGVEPVLAVAIASIRTVPIHYQARCQAEPQSRLKLLPVDPSPFPPRISKREFVFSGQRIIAFLLLRSRCPCGCRKSRHALTIHVEHSNPRSMLADPHNVRIGAFRVGGVRLPADIGDAYDSSAPIQHVLGEDLPARHFVSALRHMRSSAEKFDNHPVAASGYNRNCADSRHGVDAADLRQRLPLQNRFAEPVRDRLEVRSFCLDRIPAVHVEPHTVGDIDIDFTEPSSRMRAEYAGRCPSIHVVRSAESAACR